MPLKLEGKTYFTASEAAEKVGISRQTLWRWRQQEQIPAGHRYRRRQVIFSTTELEAIREYANHIEPIDNSNGRQMGLFNGNPPKED
jgi:predicted DNA-binding protein (UPF0251 family)